MVGSVRGDSIRQNPIASRSRLDCADFTGRRCSLQLLRHDQQRQVVEHALCRVSNESEAEARALVLEAVLLAEVVEALLHYHELLDGQLDGLLEAAAVGVVRRDSHHERRGCLVLAVDLQMSAAPSADADLGVGQLGNPAHVGTAAADEPRHEVEVGRLHVEVDVGPEPQTPRPTGALEAEALGGLHLGGLCGQSRRCCRCIRWGDLGRVRRRGARRRRLRERGHERARCREGAGHGEGAGAREGAGMRVGAAVRRKGSLRARRQHRHARHAHGHRDCLVRHVPPGRWHPGRELGPAVDHRRRPVHAGCARGRHGCCVGRRRLCCHTREHPREHDRHRGCRVRLRCVLRRRLRWRRRQRQLWGLGQRRGLRQGLGRQPGLLLESADLLQEVRKCHAHRGVVGCRS
mmetsp:Transcript_16199/g.48655  ORF Transcript_16199/g.48655 Transcript_16199/m.48655 type:complete len:405 (+) Transcript_16199:42-1256(+)